MTVIITLCIIILLNKVYGYLLLNNYINKYWIKLTINKDIVNCLLQFELPIYYLNLEAILTLSLTYRLRLVH